MYTFVTLECVAQLAEHHIAPMESAVQLGYEGGQPDIAG